MELWARGPGPTLGIRDFLQKVSFEVASSYASWAADLPNVGQNYAVAAAVLEMLDLSRLVSTSSCLRQTLKFLAMPRSVALLPDCLSELKLKDELQTRCTQKMYKIAGV